MRQEEDYFQLLVGKVGYLSAKEIRLLKEGYDFAGKAHSGQERRSGEAYLIHPVYTAVYLAEMHLDLPTLIAALLHDVVEDTEIEIKLIRELFGNEVANLVDGVTKLSLMDHVEYEYDRRLLKERKQLDSLKKMILAAVKDIRVIMIKLADRLHNIQTLGSLRIDKQIRILQETRYVYLPLATSLGLWSIKTGLENECLKLEQAACYQQLNLKLLQAEQNDAHYRDHILSFLTAQFGKSRIPIVIHVQYPEIFELYRRGVHQLQGGQVLLPLQLFIEVEKKSKAYELLGELHSLWRPLTQHLKDYLYAAKENGYQALHTTVLGPGGRKIQVVISTAELRCLAQYGVATPWFRGVKEPSKSLHHWQKLAMDQSSDAREFLQGVVSEFLPEKLSVVTPKREIRELPVGATALDFAYSLHSEMGHGSRKVLINNMIAPLNRKLQNGDEVEIIFDERGGPKHEWLNPDLEYAIIPYTLRKIRLGLRQRPKRERILDGESILEECLKRVGLPNFNQNEIGKWFNCQEHTQLLLKIGQGDILDRQILIEILGRVFHLPYEPGIESQLQRPLEVPMPNAGRMEVRVGQCCRPTVIDSIVGRISKSNKVTAHKVDCSHILREMRRDRLIQLSWQEEGRLFPIQLAILAYDRAGLMNDFSNLVQEEQVNMALVNATTDFIENRAQIMVTLRVKGSGQFVRIMERASRLTNVTQVQILMA